MEKLKNNAVTIFFYIFEKFYTDHV